MAPADKSNDANLVKFSRRLNGEKYETHVSKFTGSDAVAWLKFCDSVWKYRQWKGYNILSGNDMDQFDFELQMLLTDTRLAS